jgi:hypothetical protein
MLFKAVGNEVPNTQKCCVDLLEVTQEKYKYLKRTFRSYAKHTRVGIHSLRMAGNCYESAVCSAVYMVKTVSKILVT